ncbi:MAG: hypothetical protein H6613_18060 [Ignavibacteriales bacterium]|nr:hypothetical protein [Ignavibacteriales bacterium]
MTSFKFSSDPENPYTYSQPTEEIYSLTNEVEKIILFKKDVLINVIAADNQYWPLPWYFRKAKNVAWNFAPPNDIYKFEIIIAQPNFTEEITDKLYNLPPAGEKYLYIPLIEKDIPIRPGNYFSSYIRNDLYQKFINTTNIE